MSLRVWWRLHVHVLNGKLHVAGWVGTALPIPPKPNPRETKNAPLEPDQVAEGIVPAQRRMCGEREALALAELAALARQGRHAHLLASSVANLRNGAVRAHEILGARTLALEAQAVRHAISRASLQFALGPQAVRRTDLGAAISATETLGAYALSAHAQAVSGACVWTLWNGLFWRSCLAIWECKAIFTDALPW